MMKLVLPLLCLFSSTALCLADTADSLALRLTPDDAAPVVRNLVASEKVLLDAAPVPNAPKWRSLEIQLPMEGFVPTAALSKNFEIVDETPVYKTPSEPASSFTAALPEDAYQMGEIGESWSAITLTRRTKVYFQQPEPSSTPSAEESSTEALAPPDAPVLNLPEPSDFAATEAPAPAFDPDAALGTLAPEDLPPENVLWKSAPRSPAPVRQPQPRAAELRPAPPLLPDGIMVGPNETQARETLQPAAPHSDKPQRLLTGRLVREVRAEGPGYPLRLRSPEGRLIAFIDLSGLFINDIDPLIGERVFVRGQIFPLRPSESQLVIYAQELRLAD